MSVVRFRPEAPFSNKCLSALVQKSYCRRRNRKMRPRKYAGGIFSASWLFRRKAIPPGGRYVEGMQSSARPLVRGIASAAIPPGGRHVEGMQPSAPPLPPRHCLSSDSARRPSRRRDAIFCIVPLFAALFPLRSRSARNLIFAAVAHLVERHLAKVEVASSSLVSRSKTKRPVKDRSFCFGNGYRLESPSKKHADGMFFRACD